MSTDATQFKKWYAKVSKVCDPWLIPVRDDKSPDVPKGESAKDEKYRLSEKEALKRLESGKNVGVYLRDDLAVWDVDDPKKASEMVDDELLRKTLVTLSRTGKPHIWFLNKGVKGRDIPDVIEQRTGWRYVLVPGSYAYDKKEYEETNEKNWGLYKVKSLTTPIELGPESQHLPDELKADDIPVLHVPDDEPTVRNEQGRSLEEEREGDEKLDALLSELNPSQLDYPSRSEADMATMIKLLQKGFDDTQTLHIVEKYRPYDKTERDDYLERTLSKAKDVVEEIGKEKKDTEKKSKLDKLIDLGMSNTKEFFLDERDKACAIIEGGGHLEARQMDSKFFKQYLGKLLYENEGKGVPSDSLNSAVNTLCAHARFAHDVSHRRLHNRIAKHNGAIYYDLSDDKWRAVKITEEGWNIEGDIPPIFRRTGTMKEQAEPSREGNLEDLLDFLNIGGGDDELLFKVYLVSCFVPDIPHPILMFIGPHGSAKSDTMKFVKLLVDPSEPSLLDFQYDKTETILQLFWHYMPFYDNLSKMKEWFSNLLCRACTGQGFMKRQLYTDEEPMIYNYRRCVGFNGISISPSRPDLQDRLITFKLPRIDETERKREEELLEEFDSVRPGILGSIFSILAKAMSIREQVSLDRLPRMADFAEWGEAIARAMGYEENEFIRAYTEKKGAQRREVLEENPVGLAVLKLMEETNTWAGTPTDLLDRLNKIAEEEKIDTDQDKWPGNATWVTRRIKDIETDLNREGIDTNLEGWKHDRRWITFNKVEGQKSLANTKNTNNTKSVTSSLEGGGEFINKEQRASGTRSSENSVSSVGSVGEITQEDKAGALMTIIRNLEDEYPEGVPIENIKAEAEGEGIGADFVDEFIKRKKREGKLYRPSEGEILAAVR